MQKIINASLISLTVLFSGAALAEAPDPQSFGVFIDANIEGTALNGGLSAGGDAFVETSIATFHDGDIQSDVDIAIEMVNYGVSTANGGLSVGGNICSKISLGSLGSNSCSHDATSVSGN